MNSRRRALLNSALQKEAGKVSVSASGEDGASAMTLVAEKASLAKYMIPLDDESIALQAELRILKELESTAKPLRRESSSVFKEEVAVVVEDSLKITNALLNWSYPKAYTELTDEQKQTLMMNGGIALEDSTNTVDWIPIQKFKHLKLPRSLLRFLHHQLNIIEPTSIQKAALPVALSGRDLLGVAGTGSGKTLCYLIPLSLICLREEKALPFEQGEGPCGFVIVPNRELALQVQGIGQDLFDALTHNAQSHDRASGGDHDVLRDRDVSGDRRYPSSDRHHHHPPTERPSFRPRASRASLNFKVAIGGMSLKEQHRSLNQSPCHAIVGTPGRLQDLIEQKYLKLSLVKFLVMDESDRLLDEGFSDPIRFIYNELPHDLQTMLFSATMPPRVKNFAQSSLRHPVTIYVGKAGRANPEVIQRMEIISESSRLKFLLTTIQQTSPPVVIFCGNKIEVDEVLEFLILSGIEAAAIHGGLEQRDRTKALNEFMIGKKDVLIGTDVASKGLDLPNVQHVINFTLPVDIEDYIHRIGRTGRKGNKGLATTFVTSVFEESLLLDLRGIILEAKQEAPDFLNRLAKARGLPDATIECAYCGGPGHRVMTCSRLRAYRLRQPTALQAAMS